MSNKNKKVVIGMTGRRDSTVAAYLLKKQGYECIGVSMLLNDPDLPRRAAAFAEKKALDSDEFNLNDSYAETKNTPKEPLTSRCHLKNLDDVKSICDHLEIPFYGVKAQEIFKANVMDPLIASRLSGTSFQSCINCNQVKMGLLVEKAKILGADNIATGHYSKILMNQSTGFLNIAKGNDLENDQSYLLSRINQEILKMLILPLAEMRVDEVQKLLEMIDIPTVPSTEGTKVCYSGDSRLAQFVEVSAAVTLIKPGHLSIASEETVLADHKGLHNFHLGQGKIKLASEKNIDADLHVINIVPPTGTVYLAPVTELAFTHCQLYRFRHDPELDISRPLELFAKIGSSKTMLPALVFFKNNRSAVIRFKDAHVGMLSKGLVVALYNKNNIGASLICSGFIGEAGVIDNKKIKNYIPPEPPPMDDEEAEEREKEKKKNATPDFHF
ncbi:MAG: hypothetical protein KC493_02825 [Bacteriovoracaceae bacterium]|nr:hypothetical protein [Bacteriovoracaceae bacterium]